MGRAAPAALRARRRCRPHGVAAESPGQYPFTRGVQRRCTAAASGRCASTRASAPPPRRNKRYRYLLEQGQTGLSVAFDLPTQMGHDSDHAARARRGRQGRRGDRRARGHGRAASTGIPLDRVSTSMTINATAAILLALYVAVGRAAGRGLATSSRGTIQNDILKEYVARGTYIYPPAPVACGSSPTSSPSPRSRCRAGTRSRSPATTCARPAPRRCRSWPSRSPTGSPTCRRRIEAGLDVDAFAPQLVVLLQRAQRLPRGGRQVPRRAADVGAPHARALRRARSRAR